MTAIRTTVQRYDVAPLCKAVRTPEGYLLAEGYAGRAGVLVYRLEDGSLRRELVPPEELFNVDSLASLGRKPVTLQHPPKDAQGRQILVDATNVATYGVGDVDGMIEEERQGGFVKVRVAIRRADAVASTESGATRGLSQGYTCDVDETPGTWRGQPYDAIQRSRRYNHLALCGLGRAGGDARLRIDQADALQIDGPAWPDSTDSNRTGGRKMADHNASLEIGGVRYDGLDPDLARVIAEALQSAAQARADAATLTTERDAARADGATLKSQLDAAKKAMDECKAAHDVKFAELKAAHDAIKKKLDERDARGDADAAAADAAFQARFDARLKLLTVAGKLGVEKAAEKTDGELRKAIAAQHNPALRVDAQTDAYLTAYVDVLADQLLRADASQLATAAAAAGLLPNGQPVQPPDAGANLAAAQAEYRKSTYGG